MLAKDQRGDRRWPETLQAYEKADQAVAAGCLGAVRLRRGLAITNQPGAGGRPMELVQKALAIDSADRKGLETGRIHAYQEKNFAQASSYFKRLASVAAAEAPYARTSWLRSKRPSAGPSRHG